MSAIMTHDAYGKSRVRLTRVTRHPDRHDLIELTIAIQLEGDFAASYTDGDNRKVVATDSMKNTVYILAKSLGVANIDSFGVALAGHFLQEYPQVTRVAIDLEEQLWQRLDIDGRPHPHAFIGGSSEKRTCFVSATREGRRVHAGIADLFVLKTTDSAFTHFVRDYYTTLPDTNDRIFATLVKATWTYHTEPSDWDACHQAVRSSLLRVFATHKSLGVQQTLYAMGEAALEACSVIDEIRLEMPNKHRIPFNLQPFGLENANEVFIATDEPHGLISATIRRA